MSEVEIRNLTKRFDKVVAVDDVTLTLADGEFFGLLGPSGSGKTTLMRCVAGFIDQDAGEIAIDGTNLKVTVTCWIKNEDLRDFESTKNEILVRITKVLQTNKLI